MRASHFSTPLPLYLEFASKFANSSACMSTLIDYGKAWNGPWAMSYPDGTVPTHQTVHPTPVYESVAMGFGAYFLWRLRGRFRAGVLFAIYLVYAGTERFLVEFIRRNDHVVAGLTQAQLESLAMMIIGAVWIATVASRNGLRPQPAAA